MVCDHERRRGCGVPARFLGATLNAYPTVGRLARWCDAAVAVVTCRREARPLSFTLELLDVIEQGASIAELEGGAPSLSAAHEAGDEDARRDRAVVRRCLAALERAAIRRPEQYLWSVPVRDGRVLPRGEMELGGLDCEDRSSPAGRGSSRRLEPV